MKKLEYRILIVDDDPSIHDVVECALMEDFYSENDCIENARDELFDVKEASKNLQTINYKFDSAFQGEEAIKMIDCAVDEGLPYSLAIIDSRMPPGIDGPTTIERIFNKYSDIDIILCTAFSDMHWQDIKRKVKYKDRFVYLKKPFDIYVFRQFVSLFAFKKRKIDMLDKEMSILRQSPSSLS